MIMVSVIRRSQVPKVRPNKHIWRISGKFRRVSLREELGRAIYEISSKDSYMFNRALWGSYRLVNPFGETVYIYYSNVATDATYLTYYVETGKIRKDQVIYTVPGEFHPHFAKLEMMVRKK